VFTEVETLMASAPPALPLTSVILEALTAETRAALPAGSLVISRWPFRIGRRAERNPKTDNELVLLDTEPYRISRAHCALALMNGRFFLLDRGSRRGTVVNGEPVGRGAGRYRAELRRGVNEVVLGGEGSPWRLRITITAASTGP
jgi:pSer/pThr/pTyr-binding forkhead associated (FHA) protein